VPLFSVLMGAFSWLQGDGLPIITEVNIKTIKSIDFMIFIIFKIPNRPINLSPASVYLAPYGPLTDG